MENSKADEFLMEIAVGKGIMRKLPSYVKHNSASDCEKTVAEEVLLE